MAATGFENLVTLMYVSVLLKVPELLRIMKASLVTSVSLLPCLLISRSSNSNLSVMSEFLPPGTEGSMEAGSCAGMTDRLASEIGCVIVDS